MAFCPHCGREVGEEAAYCARCGNRLKGVGVESVPSAGAGTSGGPQTGWLPPPLERTEMSVPPPPAVPTGKRRWPYPVMVAAVALFAAVALLLALFLTRGMEMSLREYKDRAGAIHGEAGDSLSEMALKMEEVAGSLSGSEDPSQIRDALAELDGLSKESLAAITEARNDLQGLQPPKEAESLHRELLDFYEKCELIFEEASVYLAYSRELVSAMAGGYAELSRFLAGGMTTEEDVYRMLGALQEYYDSTLQGLRAVEPPEDFENFHRRFLETWSGFSPIINDLRAALADQDAARLASAESGIERWESEMNSLVEELESRFDKVGDELVNMGERGADLEDELMAL